jgi:7-cyano-7-deazaguanine reductase
MKYGENEIQNSNLEPWDNPCPDRNYTIEISFPEFSCRCPRSGYPDYATIRIHYIPGDKVVELKSLKLYLNSYRDRYISHEESTNRIYDDLSTLLKPRKLVVTGDFSPRGNVKTIIRVSSDEAGRDIDME